MADPLPQVTAPTMASTLNLCLQFNDVCITAMVQTLLPLPIDPSCYPSQHDLEKLRIWHEISDRLTSRHWIDLLTFVILVIMSYLLSYWLPFGWTKAGLVDIFRQDVIRFRSGGVVFSMCITNVGVRIGIYSTKYVQTEEYR